MVKTGQFTTNCKGDRVIALKWHGKNYFGRTPTEGMSHCAGFS